MPVIHLQTFIKAPIEVVFDLSRSVDLHKSSMIHHKEEILEGVAKGLMNTGDTVTWQAKHLLRNRKLKVTITEMKVPTFFVDEMLEGDFKRMRHEHSFEPHQGGTLMTDTFWFESPFGLFGTIVNQLFFKKYMTQLLRRRNNEIKNIAETNLWKQYLNHE